MSKSLAQPSEGADRAVRTRHEILSDLRKLGPLSDRLVKLLDLPERLYEVAPLSFSSCDGKGLAAIAASFAADVGFSPALLSMLEREAKGGEIPHFGLHVISVEGKEHCLVVDKGRKVAAYHAIEGAEGRWQPFEHALESALLVASFDDYEYSLMVCKEVTIRKV